MIEKSDNKRMKKEHLYKIKNAHLQKSTARANRTDLECAIDKCRHLIENRLIVSSNKRTDVLSLMDDIDHLCGLCRTQGQESKLPPVEYYAKKNGDRLIQEFADMNCEDCYQDVETCIARDCETDEVSKSAVMSGYAKYRGKCKEMVEEACKQDPTLTPVRGYYICWSWGKQAHWWAVKQDGTIVDPTIDQFPKPHVGDYIPFDGVVECSQCGKRVKEEHASFNGNYAFCSTACAMRFVGL